MIKRIWQAIKFIFTGNLDGYINYDEQQKMKADISTAYEKYTDKMIEDTVNTYWEKIAKTDLRTIGKISLEYLDSRILVLKSGNQSLAMQESSESNENINSKLKHDIELLG
jgi:hypothetical protein